MCFVQTPAQTTILPPHNSNRLVFKPIQTKFYAIHKAHFLTLHILTDKTHTLKYNNTDRKTHFVLGTDSYMFRQQGAILRKYCFVMCVCVWVGVGFVMCVFVSVL
jgi:hypothetical protein